MLCMSGACACVLNASRPLCKFSMYYFDLTIVCVRYKALACSYHSSSGALVHSDSVQTVQYASMCADVD